MRRAALLMVTLALGGCGVTGTSPEPRFYTLTAEPAPAAAASRTTYLVVVGPVTVPELVDRPQIVTRSAEHRVELHELARWAAPLRSEIPRVIAENLARLLPDARTATGEQRASGAPDYRVLVDVQRFDSSNAGATIQASWTVRTQGAQTLSGRSVATEAAGAGYEALAAAHSRALSRIAAEIAQAITAARAGVNGGRMGK
jgi:uncharacterized lipoprotein YmbA